KVTPASQSAKSKGSSGSHIPSLGRNASISLRMSAVFRAIHYFSFSTRRPVAAPCVASRICRLAGQVGVVIDVLHIIAVVQHADQLLEHEQVFRTKRLAGLREE